MSFINVISDGHELQVLSAVPAPVQTKIWGRLRRQPREGENLGGWGIPGGKGEDSDRLRWALRVRIDGSSTPHRWYQVNLESAAQNERRELREEAEEEESTCL